MFAHKIVESLKDQLTNGIITSQWYARNLGNVIGAIQERAVGFYLGDAHDIDIAFDDFRKGHKAPPRLFLDEAAVDIHFPYPVCLFMFKEPPTPDPGKQMTPQRAVLTAEYTNGLFIAYVMAHFKEIGSWFLSPQCYMISIGRPLTKNPDFEAVIEKKPTLASKQTFSVTEDGYAPAEFETANIQTIALMEDMELELAQRCTIDDARDLTVLNGALMLLNCRNVSYRTIQPSAKLNKKRRKKHREPLHSFKTLTIKLPGSKIPQGFSINGQDNRALHRCRGHFKTFTAEKPLFGRITGRFWWSHHLRGNPEAGTVEKDYKVEAA